MKRSKGMTQFAFAKARRFSAQAGFTLMEVLVAISIFALIGVASYRVLNTVLQTDERIAARAEQMRAVNRAFWLLQQDAEQLVRRNVRDASGAATDTSGVVTNTSGVVTNTENYLLVRNGSDLPLQFTRGGRANPLGLPRSSMQRVAYAVGFHPDYENANSPHYHEERKYLLRYTWPMLDGAGDKKQAQVQAVLPDIDSMAVGVLTKKGPQERWPLANSNDPPLALQLDFALADGSRMKRAYKLW